MGNDAKRWEPMMSADEIRLRRAIASRNAMISQVEAQRQTMQAGTRRMRWADASLRRMYRRNQRANRLLMSAGLAPGGCIRNPDRPLPDPAVVEIARKAVFNAGAN